MKIAVIGSGISGLGAAYALRTRHAVEVFEQDLRAGGHTNTISVDVGERTLPFDRLQELSEPDDYCVPLNQTLRVAKALGAPR